MCMLLTVSCQDRSEQKDTTRQADTSAASDPNPEIMQERKGIHQLEWERHRADALLTDPTTSEFELGIEAGKEGDWTKAAGIFESITKEHPKNSKAHFNLGLCYKYLRDYPEAGRSFQQAYKLEPDSLYRAELEVVEAWERELQKVK